jgi:hypothetical protein
MNIKVILAFLKTHWISLTSGAVSLASIAILALGMTSKTVVEEMQKVVSSAAEIQNLKSDPKNQATIDAEKERLGKFKEQYEAAIKVAASINERKVLMEGVFPAPRSDEVRYRFQEAYRARIARLPSEMNAGGPPTAQELQDAADEIADERRRKGLEEPEPGGGPPVPPAPAPPPGGKPDERQPGGAVPPPPGTPTGEKTASLQEEAARRAAIRKALSIQLYGESFGPRNAFQISPIVSATDPPAADDMWYAQVGLWIQEDVVRAIREVNEEAASRLDPKEANVGRMPVKHLISIRIPGYLTSQGTLVRFEGVREATTVQQPSVGGAEVPQVFTNRVGDENFDVIRFSVRAIVDQRELLRLPDRITRTNFYQLVDLDYSATLPLTGADAQGFHYGDGPVVVATYEFEGFFARKVYLDLMPEQVQAALGIIKAKGG